MQSIGHSVRLAASPPHREGVPFIAAGLVVALAGFVYHAPVAIGIGLVFTLFCFFFFRDPARVPPTRPGILVAPADGLVTAVGLAIPPEELGLGPAPMQRIATFLSVLDVHVNRAPAAGTVRAVSYRAGRFLNASLDKASDENERNALAIELADGGTIAVVQIAGLIARRIVCDVVPGAVLARGERFGMIRFGSRTDLYVPEHATVLVEPGQRMIGGETAMATVGARS